MLVPTKGIRMKEIWRRIPGKYRRYYKVSNLGRVKRIKSFTLKCWNGKVFWYKEKTVEILEPRVFNTSPYPWVKLTLPNCLGKGEGFYVHTLVLLAFRGPCPEGMQARHLNDKQSDNRLKNLKWGTPKENGEDKFRNGKVRDQWGEKNSSCKLTDSEVAFIRRTCERNPQYGIKAKLARRFGVDRGYITMLTKDGYRSRRGGTKPF